MQEHDLKSIPELQDLPILSEDDPRAGALVDCSEAEKIAEAEDMPRLYDLLYRDEYRPLAGIRCRCPSGETIRVYFRLRDLT